MENRILREFILRSIGEDLGDGDHSSLACIPWEATGKAKLLIKEDGILAGVKVAKEIFKEIDKDLVCEILIEDGSKIIPGRYCILHFRQTAIHLEIRTACA